MSDAAARRELGYVGMTSRDDGLRSYELAHPLGPGDFRKRKE
ncbi:hypothetical protein [Paraburkholderia humisilvae]|nr:hypothetical protein [Paraburkholderia humisilvae]